MTRDHLCIFVNGRRHHVRGEAAFVTLSEFLRNHLGLTGTKIVCAEGDCGSCSVLVGRLRNGAIEYTNQCSCIMAMVQVDGCHVVTVEGLGRSDSLGALQRTMVEGHAAQCGFCTPGIVVALTALCESREPLTEQRVRCGLVGNLCRCTGYDSIVRSAAAVDVSSVPRVEELFPSGSLTAEMAARIKESVVVTCGERRLMRPASMAEAIRLRQLHVDAVLLAGGTDLGVLANKADRPLHRVIYVGSIEGSDQIEASPTQVRFGSAVSLSEFDRAIRGRIPGLSEYMGWFASPPIRNAGTVAGNLVTGSPIGDLLPPLVALGAEVELASVDGRRTVPLESFYVGYRRNVMRPDEMVVGVCVPMPGEARCRFMKVSRRKEMDISAVSAAFVLQSVDGGRIATARIAFGGVGPVVLRLSEVESMLVGQTATRDLFVRAGQTAAGLVKPISDVRGSAEYRRELVASLFDKAWHDLFSTETPR
jgi:xanthine dehydrogenase small subunit